MFEEAMLLDEAYWFGFSLQPINELLRYEAGVLAAFTDTAHSSPIYVTTHFIPLGLS